MIEIVGFLFIFGWLVGRKERADERRRQAELRVLRGAAPAQAFQRREPAPPTFMEVKPGLIAPLDPLNSIRQTLPERGTEAAGWQAAHDRLAAAHTEIEDAFLDAYQMGMRVQAIFQANQIDGDGVKLRWELVSMDPDWVVRRSSSHGR